MTKEDKELDHRFWCSLNIFEMVIKDYKKRNDYERGNDFIKFLESAHEAFCDVHEQWRHKIGTPSVINANVTAKILREIADDIERDHKHFLL